MNIFIWNRLIYRVPTHTEKQLCKSLVAQTSWPLSSVGENIIPILSVLGFLLLDYSSMGARQMFPGGCKHITLEQFSLFKMSARMSEFLVNHNILCSNEHRNLIDVSKYTFLRSSNSESSFMWKLVEQFWIFNEIDARMSELPFQSIFESPRFGGYSKF